MKTGRVVVCALVVGAVVVAFFTIPLPVSRVRQVGVVMLQADAETPVLLHEDGRLDKLMVRDGQHVRKGEELAVLSNHDLERKRDEAQTQVDILRKESEAYQRQLAGDKAIEQERRNRLQRSLAEVSENLGKYKTQLDAVTKELEALKLVAPCDGVVINPPKPDDVGKFYDHNQPAPFCTIGDPERLRVLLPVKPADYRLLKQDREAAEKKDRDLPITIRVQGRDSHTWQGAWLSMPGEAAKTIPPQLANKGGGPIAVKPPSAADPNRLEPVDQQYLLSLAVKDPDKAIVPGSMARVKIDCGWRSCAWWVWRTVNDTFDLGLM